MPARQCLLIVAACVLLTACRAPHRHASRTSSESGPEPHPGQVAGAAPVVSGMAVSPQAPLSQLVGYTAFVGPAGDAAMAQAAPQIVLPTAGASVCGCQTCQSGYSHLPQSAFGGEPGSVMPEDEYIYDGGDRLQSVEIARDWTVRGMDAEDTVAHYDTVDGKTHVTASNRLPIYAPRFAAVRQVTAAVNGEHQSWPIGVVQPERIVSQERRDGANSVSQPEQIERHLAIVGAYGFRDRNKAQGLDNVRFLQGIDFALLPYENLSAIRDGVYEANEKARLSEAVLAAKTWTLDQNPEVLVDGKAAFEATAGGAPEVTIRYDMPKGKPRVTITKLASKQNALPGDTVHFTIRFDNVGDQPVGNVTILDKLTPRLAYKMDSAKCTVDADFFQVEQEDGTTLLRWEIKNPLKVSEGGVLHFECQVR